MIYRLDDFEVMLQDLHTNMQSDVVKIITAGSETVGLFMCRGGDVLLHRNQPHLGTDHHLLLGDTSGFIFVHWLEFRKLFFSCLVPQPVDATKWALP